MPTSYPQQVELPFIADKLTNLPQNVEQLNATTLNVTGPTTLDITGYGTPYSNYNPAKIINYAAGEVVEDIPIWHPASGYHTPQAMEAINVIGSTNPAKYNYSTLTIGNNSYDPLRPWGEKELGRTWFDTTNLAYVPYYDQFIFPNRGERLSRWGALADHSTVDVYEWVKSTVPPSEYAKLAQTEALDADIPDSEKASGDVALQQTYSRDRIWHAIPVAWSKTGTLEGGHPSFNSSYTSRLYFGINKVWIQHGLFSQYGIEPGMRIGAWSPTEHKPYSELVLSDQISKVITYDGNETAPLVSPLTTTISGTTFSILVTSSKYTEQTGQLIFSDPGIIIVPIVDGEGNAIGSNVYVSIRVTDVDTKLYEDLLIWQESTTSTSSTPSLELKNYLANETWEFISELFGISIKVSLPQASSFQGISLQQAIIQALSDKINVKDAIATVSLVEFPLDLGYSGILSNDPADAVNSVPNPINNRVNSLGWIAWQVPTQAELTNDGKNPKRAWKPYSGNLFQFNPSAEELSAAIDYEKTPLVLNDGTKVSRYSMSWTDWRQLKNTVYTKVQIQDGTVSFNHIDLIDITKTSVYVNGLVQLKAGYSVVDNTLTVLSVAKGSKVTVIIRHYTPSNSELNFNPELAEDLTFQTQYKVDSDYVALPVRSKDGSINSQIYYFWVKNRTSIAYRKKLSTQAIVQLLKTGPNNFMLFQAPDTGLLGNGTEANPFRYDAIAISNLSNLVGRDNTYKIRFTENFILRNDPNELDLKNQHAEWGLIRKDQKMKIPAHLWDKLVDSLVGFDKAGNQIPSLRRKMYDDRNNTATQFGFLSDQILAPSNLLKTSVCFTIVNTKLTVELPNGSITPDYIQFIDQEFNLFETNGATSKEKDRKVGILLDNLFATTEQIRSTMSKIWALATAKQINELFFNALEDIVASNLQLTDLFKTSRLAAYSVKQVPQAVASTLIDD